MASLDDIWDTPAETSASSLPRPADDDYDDVLGSRPKRSTARPRSTLFLESGSEDEAPAASRAHYATKPSSSKPDIDAFWDDLDADPESTFQELAPSLDIASMKRQADANLPLTPHQVLPSSSPPRDTGNAKDGGSKDKPKKSKEAAPSKKKRAVLDEGRLLGPDGFPALVKISKDFKPKGKGHELSDLNRLLNVYQFWSHQMYPNTRFTDTVERVEKLCHTKRMHVALGVWRDEAKGLINGHKLSRAGGSDDSDSENDNGENAPRPTDVPVAIEDERESSPAPSTRGPSVPPSSASEGGFGEDFDIDAMIREEEAAQAASPRSSAPSTSIARPAIESGVPMDEDEALWDAVMDDFPDEPPRAPQAQARQPVVPPTSLDEDEDMWDIVREMEMEAETTAKSSEAPPSAGPSNAIEGSEGGARTTGLVGADPTRKATNDEGWDEMYA